MINVTTTDGEAMPRHRIEAAIAMLIDYLDSVDPDADLEPTTGWCPYGLDELESDLADDRSGTALERDNADDEPSLGWTNQRRQEGAAWLGDSYGDDREHDEEREFDPAEFGIADQDGLAEQTGGWFYGEVQ